MGNSILWGKFEEKGTNICRLWNGISFKMRAFLSSKLNTHQSFWKIEWSSFLLILQFKKVAYNAILLQYLTLFAQCTDDKRQKKLICPAFSPNRNIDLQNNKFWVNWRKSSNSMTFGQYKKEAVFSNSLGIGSLLELCGKLLV